MAFYGLGMFAQQKNRPFLNLYIIFKSILYNIYTILKNKITQSIIILITNKETIIFPSIIRPVFITHPRVFNSDAKQIKINAIISYKALLQQMANGVNTEWFDLQVKFGNYQPKEKQRSLAEIQKEAQEKYEEENKLQNRLDEKDMNQIKQMEDDLDFDDEFMRQYMAKRRAQMVEKAAKHKYGQVIEISRDEYMREVTQANPDDFVVIHLYQDSNEYCTLINQYLPKLAAEQPHIKFVKIISTKCIENFPDSKCPCFIIYKAGKPVGNIVNVDLQIDRKVENLPTFLRSQGLDIQ